MHIFLRWAAAVLALALTSSPTAAQDAPFVPGYLVVEGDTLRGEVAVGYEVAATRGARFRAGPAADAREIRPADAEAFGTDAGRSYRRGRYPAPPAADADAPAVVPPLAFARVVVDGPAALLSYEPVTGEPVFFADLGEGPVGLYLVEREVWTGRGYRTQTQAQYRQALLVLLAECPPGEAAVADLPYTAEALGGVVAAYNGCVDPTYRAPAVRPGERRRTTARVALGLGYAAGRFVRRTPRSTPGEDPAPQAFHASLGAQIAPWFAPDRVRFIAGVRYEYDVLRIARGLFTVREEQLDVLMTDLGVRVGAPVAKASVAVGVGLLLGTTLERTTAEEISLETRPGLTRFVRDGATGSVGGQYLDVTLGVGATQLSVRAQGLAFADAPVLLPALSTAEYGVETVGVSLVRTF